MIENNPLQLQIVINKLLELAYQENNIKTIVKKSLNIILNSPISSSISNKGIIFITEDNSKLRLIAEKNIEKEIATSCRKVDFSECVCGMAAHTKQVQFTSCITHLHKKISKTKNHGHYSIPILYNETVYGVLTLYLNPNHVKNKFEIETLQTITKTLGLIIYKKRLAKFARFNRTKLDVSFGQKYFNTLAKFLTKEIGMKYCVIGSYNKQENTITTYTFTQNNKVLKNITYHLEGTPCNNVFDAAYCFYPQNIQQLFPTDKYLEQLGAESYFAMPLINEKKVRIGIVAMLGDKPIGNELEKKEILNVFIP
ncbi:MAG: GAF domain-containing protein [Bacteroidetes bacterium]|nr:GAF domain-containing protein [Bacteroidota bacterium]